MTHTQDPRQPVSRQDVESVSQKLAALAKDLPESERAVLGLVLSRAQAAPSDLDPAEAGRVANEQVVTERPGAKEFEKPFAGQLARAAGLFASPQVTVVVGWQYRFGVEGIEDAVDPVVRPIRDIDAGPA